MNFSTVRGTDVVSFLADTQGHAYPAPAIGSDDASQATHTTTGSRTKASRHTPHASISETTTLRAVTSRTRAPRTTILFSEMVSRHATCHCSTISDAYYNYDNPLKTKRSIQNTNQVGRGQHTAGVSALHSPAASFE